MGSKFDWQNTIEYNATQPRAIVPQQQPLPPVAWGQRDTPVGRADSIESGVKVPFYQGLVVGLFPGAVVGIVTGTVIALSGGPWWVVPVAGATVWLSVAGWRVWVFVEGRQEVLWQIERLGRHDLDGDGHVGKPTVTVEVMEPERNKMRFIDLGLEPERAIKFARGVTSGRGLTVAEWTGHGGLVSRSEFERLRGRLIETGLARWVSPHAKNQGVTLTRKGELVLTQLANLSPSDLG